MLNANANAGRPAGRLSRALFPTIRSLARLSSAQLSSALGSLTSFLIACSLAGSWRAAAGGSGGVV